MHVMMGMVDNVLSLLKYIETGQNHASTVLLRARIVLLQRDVCIEKMTSLIPLTMGIVRLWVVQILTRIVFRLDYIWTHAFSYIRYV